MILHCNYFEGYLDDTIFYSVILLIAPNLYIKHLLHSDRTIELALRCYKPEMSHLLESSMGLDQNVSEQSEIDFKFKVTLADSEDLRFWLLAQSPFSTILSPDWLRQEIHEMLQPAIKRLDTS